MLPYPLPKHSMIMDYSSIYNNQLFHNYLFSRTSAYKIYPNRLLYWMVLMQNSYCKDIPTYHRRTRQINRRSHWVSKCPENINNSLLAGKHLDIIHWQKWTWIFRPYARAHALKFFFQKSVGLICQNCAIHITFTS